VVTNQAQNSHAANIRRWHDSLLGRKETTATREQGRKQPSAAARTLLAIAGTNPKALLAVANNCLANKA